MGVYHNGHHGEPVLRRADLGLRPEHGHVLTLPKRAQGHLAVDLCQRRRLATLTFVLVR